MSLPSPRPTVNPNSSAALGAGGLLVLPQVVVFLLNLPVFGEGPPRSALCARLNPNDASVAELALLPGVGPILARRLATERELAVTQPAFRSLQDLDRVPGIGPEKLAALREYIALPDEAPRDESPANEPPAVVECP